MRPYRHKQPSKIQDIADALIASGYKALDEQAKALGIHRATAWTIIRNTNSVGYRQKQYSVFLQILKLPQLFEKSSENTWPRGQLLNGGQNNDAAVRPVSDNL